MMVVLESMEVLEVNRSCIFCKKQQCTALTVPECKGRDSDIECAFYKSKCNYYKDKNGYIVPFIINNKTRR